MIKVLAKSIREYKKPSLLAPILVSGEVVLECIIPFLTANLVNEIKNGCSLGVIVQYGLVLIAMAALSLTFGALAGSACATGQVAALPAICERICFLKYRAIPLKILISFLYQALLHD